MATDSSTAFRHVIAKSKNGTGKSLALSLLVLSRLTNCFASQLPKKHTPEEQLQTGQQPPKKDGGLLSPEALPVEALIIAPSREVAI